MPNVAPLPQAHPAPQLRPSRYQVYGERCSGTHFIIKLLEHNIVSARFTEEYGFKHWFGPGASAFPLDCAVVVVAREPVAWAQSFHRKPWHAAPELRKLSFSDFIRSEWVGGTDDDGIFVEHRRERDPMTGERFADIWNLREAKLLQWTALKPTQPLIRVSYDMALSNPEAFLDEFCMLHGFERRESFTPILTYKGLGEEGFMPSAYEPVSDEDRAFIASRLNGDLEAKWFGASGPTV